MSQNAMFWVVLLLMIVTWAVAVALAVDRISFELTRL